MSTNKEQVSLDLLILVVNIINKIYNIVTSSIKTKLLSLDVSSNLISFKNPLCGAVTLQDPIL